MLIIFFIVAFILTFKRSWSLHFVIWGIYLAIFFTPIFTIAGSFIYADITKDGFAGIGFLTLFVPLEIIAILIFIVGFIGCIISKKKKHNQTSSNVPL
ncbi:hypothetical protein [Lysinibacillus fusiformis]|uniref:hypothetical protein n=1 Tax=Lysinibacillus fusiformis TaxID=28031 RepID=UPI0037FD02B8